MHHLQFLDPGANRTLALSGAYDPTLVVASVLMASLAAYAAFGLADRINAAEVRKSKLLWLWAGATAMAVGIWAMHFIGMLAFRLPIAVAYDLAGTAISVAPAVVASAIVLDVTSRDEVSFPRLLVAGTVMGLGIGAMHYAGMAAMRLAADMYYDRLLFGGSLVVAVVLATLALWVHVLATAEGPRQSWPWKLGAAATMGSAVAGMHYTAMAAAYFFPSDDKGPLGAAIDPNLLAVLVGIAAALVLAVAGFVVVIDTRLKEAAHSVRTNRARMIHAIESVSEGFCLYGADDRLVLCNSRYQELLQNTDEEVVGDTFESIIRRAVQRGLIPLHDRDVCRSGSRIDLQNTRTPRGRTFRSAATAVGCRSASGAPTTEAP